MLYINNPEKLKKINFNSNDFYVVIDFDRTLTTCNSLGSWNVLENPKIFSEDCVKECKKLTDIYYPYELDYTLNFETKEKYMEEWYYGNMNLFYKYGLTYSILMDCIKNGSLTLRDGANGFLLMMKQHHIPVIILSAGIGNVISEILKINKCDYDNIHIISNFIEFKDDKMLPFNSNMIHSLNKNLTVIPDNLRKKICNKKSILLIGDLIEDILMVQKADLYKTLTIGFLETKINENLNFYNKNFDIVFTENSSFKDIESLIFSKDFF